jgi:15-cis-phytoene synthase
MRRPPKPLEEPYRSRAVPPGTVRYWSWLFAARDSRGPLLGIYALLAEWRALMDPGTEATVAQVKLAWWQEEIQRLTAGLPLHPISRHLAALPRAEVTEFAPLERAVEAAARHIAGAPLERSEDLEAHASALRGGPYMVAARLAGERAQESAAGLGESVRALAAAEYLQGTIADYRREARIGRVAFPVDELLAAHIEDADLAAADPPAHLQSYLQGLRRRTAQSFARAIELLPRAERAPLRHVWVLAALGAKHLNSRRPASEAESGLGDLYAAWTNARRAAKQP